MPIAALGPAAAAGPPRAAASPLRFGPLLSERLGAQPPPASGPAPTLGLALRSVEAAQVRLDAVLSAARKGQAFSAGQLLALQSDAYRFTQTLDLAGKLVEQGVQGVKQAIQTPL